MYIPFWDCGRYPKQIIQLLLLRSMSRRSESWWILRRGHLPYKAFYWKTALVGCVAAGGVSLSPLSGSFAGGIINCNAWLLVALLGARLWVACCIAVGGRQAGLSLANCGWYY
jgi:hypothetical protein